MESSTQIIESKTLHRVQIFHEFIITSNIAKTSVITCPVCDKEVLTGHASRSGHSSITKLTSCCGIFKTAHFIYAKKFSIKLNNNYNFDSKTYVNNTSSPLFYINCNEKYFHCGKKHNMANNLNVLLCAKYNAKWCYALSKTNKKLSCIENYGNGKQA